MNQLVGTYPLLDLAAAVEQVLSEIEIAVRAIAVRAPGPLRATARDLTDRSERERRSLVETWIDDPSLMDPRLALWIQIAAAPILEGGATRIKVPSKEEWSGRSCPACGDAPQCSAIVEESGAFMQGSPRYLVCGRCASWWPFARATCPACGEDDSRRVSPYVADEFPWVRADGCDTCRTYIKTFDLRKPEARDVVPLVDDVATLTLDVWAHETGLHRPVVSLAGV